MADIIQVNDTFAAQGGVEITAIEPVVVTVEEREAVRLNGKLDRYTITRYKGRAAYRKPSGKELLLVEATYSDHGPNNGGWTFVAQKDATPEERAAGRRHIQEVLTEVLIQQGVW